MEKLTIPRWKFSKDKYRYNGNTSFKVRSLVVGAGMVLISISIAFVLLKDIASFAFTGDQIGAVLIVILMAFFGWWILSSANVDDKFIDTRNQTLNIKRDKKFVSIPFSKIVGIVGTQKYINNNFHGIFYSYLLENQREPIRGIQELSEAIPYTKSQNEFVVNMSSLLKIENKLII
jgi:hypothetical protein